jgi:pimeloyl-ACP methyl ester carboxylesterase
MDINGFNMEYTDRGTDIPLLLIHGYPLNRTIWDPQIAGFDNRVRVIAPDLRGFGGSDPIGGDYSMEMLADDCKELLDHIGLKQKVFIGGLSMGGYVALAFCRLFPGRAAGLVLASTKTGPDNEEGKANRNKAIQTAMQGGAPAIAQNMLPKMLAPAAHENNHRLVEQVRRIMETASVEGITGALAGMRDRLDSSDVLANLHIPVILFHGQEDQIMPPSSAEEMHRLLPSSELHILPEAGHLINMEQPQKFNEILLPWLVRESRQV